MSDDLRGKRYINFLRSATLTQGNIAEQKRVNDEFARQRGMIHVRDIVFEGVSETRRDLDALLRERREQTSFDVLLVADLSRLGRGLFLDGLPLYAQFARHDVQIVSVAEGDSMTSMQRIHRTVVSAVLGECCSVGSHREHDVGIPYGIDRLLVGRDGTPFIRLRFGGNGVRFVMDPEATQVFLEFNPVAHGKWEHRKRYGEKVRLVPGAEDKVNAVREIFNMRYRHDWGYARITRRLLQQGVEAPRGERWHASTVRSITFNPLYLGWSYPINRSRMFDRLLHPTTDHPRIDVYLVKYAHLKDFIIDALVRGRAEKAIRQQIERQIAGSAPRE